MAQEIRTNTPPGAQVQQTPVRDVRQQEYPTAGDDRAHATADTPTAKPSKYGVSRPEDM